MKTIKKLLAILLAVLMMISFAVIVSASDSEKIISTPCGENATWIVDFEKETVTFSGTGIVDGDYIKADFFGQYDYMDIIAATKTIIIEEGITDIRNMQLTYFMVTETIVLPSTFQSSVDMPINLKEIKLSEDNPYFVLEDGVLFNKDKTELILYAGVEDGATYKVPESVKKISNFAFAFNSFESIVLHEGIEEVGYGAFNMSYATESIIIPKSVRLVLDGFWMLKDIEVEGNITPDSFKELMGNGEFGFKRKEGFDKKSFVELMKNAYLKAAITGVGLEEFINEMSKYFYLDENMNPILGDVTLKCHKTFGMEEYVNALKNEEEYNNINFEFFEGHELTYEWGWEGAPENVCDRKVAEKITCSECGVLAEDVYVGGHVETVRNYKEATCEEEGYSGDYCCMLCDEFLWAGYTISKAHNYEVKTVTLTCTQDGKTTYTCKTCKDYKEENVVKAEGHKVVIDPAVEATETESGLTEGSHCEKCGEVFVAQEVVDPIKNVTTGNFYLDLLIELLKSLIEVFKNFFSK